jgi:hypothetical protein
VDAALLIVLVGELTAPLRPHLVNAVPAAFEEKVEVVAEAPPGRDVVWVTAPSRDEVVLTLHVAGEQGDLRRELKFSRSDPQPARGRAVAFAIASMRAERKPKQGTAPPTAVTPSPNVSHWFLSARGFGALMLPIAAGQGGALLEAQYLFPFHLAGGVGSSFSGGSAQNVSWLQPALWVSGSVRFDTGAFVPRVSLGVGAVASVVTSTTVSTTWQPYFRAAADLTWRFARPHGLIFGVAANFTTAGLVFTTKGNNGNGNGNGNTKTVTLGPTWVALELGYAVDF